MEIPQPRGEPFVDKYAELDPRYQGLVQDAARYCLGLAPAPAAVLATGSVLERGEAQPGLSDLDLMVFALHKEPPREEVRGFNALANGKLQTAVVEGGLSRPSVHLFGWRTLAVKPEMHHLLRYGGKIIAASPGAKEELAQDALWNRKLPQGRELATLLVEHPVATLQQPADELYNTDSLDLQKRLELRRRVKAAIYVGFGAAITQQPDISDTRRTAEAGRRTIKTLRRLGLPGDPAGHIEHCLAIRKIKANAPVSREILAAAQEAEAAMLMLAEAAGLIADAAE